MMRRTFLASAGAAMLPTRVAAVGGPLRRVRPSDAAWPSIEAWAALNARVGGKLVRPKPLFAPCADPTEADACRAILKESANPFFVGDQLSGTQVSGWFKAWTPQTSAYAIVAHGADDVVQGVNFARENNLRLVVKGPGHSYLGCSNARDSLLIWTRPLSDILVHDAFTPLGCEGQCEAVPAVSAGGGAVWIDVYHNVAVQNGRYAQGGGCADVGVAGLVQGGGFGSLSKGFGTAGSSLIEAEVVTADGQIRTVNAARDPDLYWALKGGGGGNFAVVTRVTLQTHDLPANFGAADGAFKAKSDDAFRALLDRFFAVYADNLLNPHWGEQAHIQPDNVLKVTMLSQGLDEGQMHAAWKPLLDWVADPKNGVETTEPFSAIAIPARLFWDFEKHRALGIKDVTFDDRPGVPPWHAWWNGDQGQVGAFLHGYDSTWLPQRLLAPDRRPALADAFFAASRAHGLELHFNKGLAGAPPEAIAASRDTPMNPAVLDAFVLVIVADGSLPAYPGSPYPPVNAAAAQKNADAIDRAMLPLRRLAPGAGSYVAESNFFNPHWREEYWGEHYARLRRIKARYDPQGLFITHHGVGSEDWSEDGFTRRI
ncbi:MAG TPA: FAD-binding oxidoreductase [Caulobacteraceae bacterium]|nr:FAD-binding oxidoreductase [Caulobacteraceae bacterium]